MSSDSDVTLPPALLQILQAYMPDRANDRGLLGIPPPLRRLLRDRLGKSVAVSGFWQGVQTHVFPHFIEDVLGADRCYQHYLVMRTQADVLGYVPSELNGPIRNQLAAVEQQIAMTSSMDSAKELTRHFDVTREKLMDLLRELNARTGDAVGEEKVSGTNGTVVGT